jgi:putative endonuclease
LGAAGEDAAVRRYAERGYRLVARNWRCPAGELDLVLARAGVLVFCEVKTRSSAALGGGFEAVTSRKQRKLKQLAETYLVANRVHESAIRFDVASVSRGAGDRIADVEIFEDAF